VSKKRRIPENSRCLLDLAAGKCQMEKIGLNITPILRDDDISWLNQNTWKVRITQRKVPQRINWLGRALWRYFDNSEIEIYSDAGKCYASISADEFHTLKNDHQLTHYKI
jgi:hypothetical protein